MNQNKLFSLKIIKDKKNIEEVQLAEYLELTRTMAVLIYVSDPTIIECVEQAAIVEDASVFKDVTERV